MKFKVRFPALVRGVPPQCRTERVCLVSSMAEFEIAEVPISEMPLAAVAHAPNSVPIEYRIRDGVLHGFRDDVDVLEIEIEAEDILAFGSSMLYHEVAAEIMSFLSLHREETWPRNAHRRQKDGARTMEESGIALSAAGAADLEYWRERTQTALRRYVIADGRVWARSREPLLAVNLKSGTISIDDAGLYRNEPLVWTVKRRPRLAETAKDYVCVSAADRDAALALLREEGHAVNDADGTHIDIVIPEAFGFDIDRLELDRATRVVVEQVSDGLARAIPGGTGNLLYAAPPALINSWLSLREYLGGYDPLDGVPEDLGERLAGFLGELDQLPPHWGEIVVDAGNRKMIQRALAGWDDRPVALSTSPSTRP